MPGTIKGVIGPNNIDLLLTTIKASPNLVSVALQKNKISGGAFYLLCVELGRLKNLATVDLWGNDLSIWSL